MHPRLGAPLFPLPPSPVLMGSNIIGAAHVVRMPMVSSEIVAPANANGNDHNIHQTHQHQHHPMVMMDNFNFNNNNSSSSSSSTSHNQVRAVTPIEQMMVPKNPSSLSSAMMVMVMDKNTIQGRAMTPTEQIVPKYGSSAAPKSFNCNPSGAVMPDFVTPPARSSLSRYSDRQQTTLSSLSSRNYLLQMPSTSNLDLARVDMVTPEPLGVRAVYPQAPPQTPAPAVRVPQIESPLDCLLLAADRARADVAPFRSLAHQPHQRVSVKDDFDDYDHYDDYEDEMDDDDDDSLDVNGARRKRTRRRRRRRRRRHPSTPLPARKKMAKKSTAVSSGNVEKSCLSCGTSDGGGSWRAADWCHHGVLCNMCGVRQTRIKAYCAQCLYIPTKTQKDRQARTNGACDRCDHANGYERRPPKQQ